MAKKSEDDEVKANDAVFAALIRDEKMVHRWVAHDTKYQPLTVDILATHDLWYALAWAGERGKLQGLMDVWIDKHSNDAMALESQALHGFIGAAELQAFLDARKKLRQAAGTVSRFREQLIEAQKLIEDDMSVWADKLKKNPNQINRQSHGGLEVPVWNQQHEDMVFSYRAAYIAWLQRTALRKECEEAKTVAATAMSSLVAVEGALKGKYKRYFGDGSIVGDVTGVPFAEDLVSAAFLSYEEALMKFAQEERAVPGSENDWNKAGNSIVSTFTTRFREHRLLVLKEDAHQELLRHAKEYFQEGIKLTEEKAAAIYTFAWTVETFELSSEDKEFVRNKQAAIDLAVKNMIRDAEARLHQLDSQRNKVARKIKKDTAALFEELVSVVKDSKVKCDDVGPDDWPLRLRWIAVSLNGRDPIKRARTEVEEERKRKLDCDREIEQLRRHDVLITYIGGAGPNHYEEEGIDEWEQNIIQAIVDTHDGKLTLKIDKLVEYVKLLYTHNLVDKTHRYLTGLAELAGAMVSLFAHGYQQSTAHLKKAGHEVKYQDWLDVPVLGWYDQSTCKWLRKASVDLSLANPRIYQVLEQLHEEFCAWDGEDHPKQLLDSRDLFPLEVPKDERGLVAVRVDDVDAKTALPITIDFGLASVLKGRDVKKMERKATKLRKKLADKATSDVADEKTKCVEMDARDASLSSLLRVIATASEQKELMVISFEWMFRICYGLDVEDQVEGYYDAMRLSCEGSDVDTDREIDGWPNKPLDPDSNDSDLEGTPLYKPGRGQHRSESCTFVTSLVFHSQLTAAGTSYYVVLLRLTTTSEYYFMPTFSLYYVRACL